MAHTACLVCFISTVNGHRNKKRKEKKKEGPWKAGSSNRHTTNLKQSILKLSISMLLHFLTLTIWSQQSSDHYLGSHPFHIL